MSRGEEAGFTDLVMPGAGESSRFVNVAVHGDMRLPGLNETRHGNAPDVYI